MSSIKDHEFVQVYTTLEKKQDAERIAEVILEKRLAACVHIMGPISSSYWWEGSLETSTEYVLLAKTVGRLYEELEDAIKVNHHYLVPEIIALPIIEGNEKYLEWINNEVRAP
jgi:periplasmic divalent cation tolerance protein